MKSKILIVEDHPVTLAGIRTILEPHEHIEILGEACDGFEAIEKANLLQPDIVIMDITMPQLSGIKATQEILKNQPDIKVIALSIHTGQNYVKGMLDAGAVGYILKDETSEELVKAINRVKQGDMFLSTGITRVAIDMNLNKEESSDLKVMNSKLHRPLLMHDQVIRARIIQDLENNISRPLTLVTAGAGYGKSISISQWLEQTKHLKTWISLDQGDNDIRTFISYIVHAVDKISPGYLPSSKSMVAASMLPPFYEMCSILINELCDIEENLIMVLDNYHLIKEQQIHDFLNAWLRFPPPNLHLCIISRRDPPLNTNSLRISGRVNQIRMKELSFSNLEIAELFKLTNDLKLNEKMVESLYNKTEGWIISLRLFSILVNEEEDLNKILKSLDKGHYVISEYLLNEVFSQQSENIQNELLICSILDRFCSELIHEVSAEGNKEEKNDQDDSSVLNWLKKNDLFLVPLDNVQKWYRFHHLFQDFLQDELKNRRTQRDINNLHIRASNWLEKENILTDAIEHAMKGGDTERAVRIIHENWEKTNDSDDFLTVEKWLSYVPEEVIRSSISLLFARFYMIFKSYKLIDLPAILKLILKFESQLAKAQKGYLSFVKSMVNYYTSAGEESLRNALQALENIPEIYHSYRADARSYWFLSMLMLGRHREALDSHRKSIKKFLDLNEPVQLGRVRTNIGFYALLNADLPLLKEITREMAKTSNLSNYMQGFLWLNRQMICWYSNDLSGVIKESEKVLAVRYEFASRLVIDSYIMKALALQDLDNPDNADETMFEAIAYAKHTKDPGNIAVAMSGRARLDLKQGNLDKASIWLDATKPRDIDPSILWCTEEPGLTRCRIQLSKGKNKDISDSIKSLKIFCEFTDSVNYKTQTIQITIMLALAYHLHGKKDLAVNSLKFAIDLAAPGEWIRPFAEQISDISEQLKQLRQEGIEPAFIDSIFDSARGIKNKKAQKVESEEVISRKEKFKDVPVITPSERKVLDLISEGLRNQEIAEKLFISQETVKKHIYNMFQKLDAKNRLNLVTKAREEGILI